MAIQIVALMFQRWYNYLIYETKGDLGMRMKKTRYSGDTGEIYSIEDYIESDLILNDPSQLFRKVFNAYDAEYEVKVYEAYFNKLTKYLEHNTNRLVYKRKKDRKIYHYVLTLQDIENELGISRTSTFRFLKESHRLHYLTNYQCRGIHKGYYVNPLYAMNGKGVTVEIYLMFNHDPKLQKRLTKRDKNKINEYLAITGEK